MTILSPIATVLVVDDHIDLLTNLAGWLEEEGFRSLTATHGHQAMELLLNERVDVVVTDLDMPGMNGLELLTCIRTHDPRIQILVLTGQATVDTAIAALRHGHAFDLLRKPLKDMQVLRDTIDQALAHRPSTAPLPSPLNALTDREREIMRCLALGIENKEIANRLCLSEKTVRNHLTRIYEKLGVCNRMQAILLFQQVTS